MKILLLTASSPHSPQGVATVQLAQLISQLGHDVDVMAFPPRAHLASYGWMHPGTLFSAWWQLARLYYRCLRDPSLQHVHLVQSVDDTLLAANVLCRRLRCPHIHCMLDGRWTDVDELSGVVRLVARVRRRIDRWSLAAVRGIVVTTQFLEDRVARDLSATPVVRIEQLIWPHASGTPAELDVQMPGSRPHVVYWGDYARPHDLRLLLDAVTYLATAWPTMQLILLGATPADQRRWRRAIQQRGLQPRITWLPVSSCAAIFTTLRQADVLVAPRCDGAEPAANLLAYIAASAPIVATRVAAHDLLPPREVALRVPPTAIDFYLGILRLLQDKTLCQRLTNLCRSYVQEQRDDDLRREKLGLFYDSIPVRHDSPPL